MNTTTSRLPWRTKVLLVASLLLNGVLVILLFWPPVPSSVRAYSALPLGALARTLEEVPQADALLLRDAILRRGKALETANERYQLAVESALGRLAADRLDLPALQRDVAGARRARQDAADELLGAVYETLPVMSAEGRRKLVAGGSHLARDR